MDNLNVKRNHEAILSDQAGSVVNIDTKEVVNVVVKKEEPIDEWCRYFDVMDGFDQDFYDDMIQK